PALGTGTTLSNAHGLYAFNQGASGVTNAYGVYIQPQSGAASINLSLYVGGTSAFYGVAGFGANGLNAGTAADITFGAAPGGSGEGMGSRRTSGGSQFGLDFYTGSNVRMSIDNGGLMIFNTHYGNLGANAGTGGAPPAQVAGYWQVSMGGTLVK